MISPLPTAKMVGRISAFQHCRRCRRGGKLARNARGLPAIALFGAARLMFAPSVLAGQGWEYWSKYSFEIAGRNQIGFSLQPEFRFRDSFNEYYCSKTYVGLFHKVDRFIKIKGYYAYKTNESKTGWRQTDLMYLDPILKCGWLDLDFSTRLRFEYDLNKEELMHRTRLKAGRSVFGKTTMFAGDETFYSFLSNRLVENRLSLGSSVGIWKKARVSGGHVFRNTKRDSGWRSVNVLVSGLSFSL